jgi:hypothetical protein
MQVHGVERHNLFVSLAPGVEHPHSVELPPRNVQRCYEDTEDDHEVGARAGVGKSPSAPDKSKKRAGSSRAQESPEDSTRKHRHMVRDWSEDEVEEDVSAYMLNPRKRSEQTIQGGSTPSAKGPQEGQTPPTAPTPTLKTTEKETRPSPQDEGQGSSARQTSQGQPRRCAFATIHRSSNL